MKTSDTIGKISEALAKAQAALTNPTKDAENPHFKSRYASLDAGLNIVRAALSANNISFVQGTRIDGELLILETLISHSSGEWMQSEYPVCKFPARPQELGSSMSYAKRYSLFALVGIAGEDDDDGNAANTRDIPASPKRVPTPPKPPSDTLDVEASQLARDMLLSAIEMAESVSDLQKWQVDNNATIAKLLEADKQVVRDAFGDRRQALRGKEQAA